MIFNRNKQKHWRYISDEDGENIARICQRYFTGFGDGDCPACPIRNACMSRLFPLRKYEYRLANAAAVALSNGHINALYDRPQE